MWWCQIDAGTTGTELLQRKLQYDMVHEEILPLNQLKLMVLCAAWGVVNARESSGCLLRTLLVAAEGIVLELSLIVELQWWCAVVRRVGAA